MPLLSSTLLIRTHALTLLTTAYFLLYSPSTLQNAGIVWILGESMHVPETPTFLSPSPLTAALALALLTLALTHWVFASQIANIQQASVLLRRRNNNNGSNNDISSKRGDGSGGAGAQELAGQAGQALGSWMLLAGVQVLGCAGVVGWMYVRGLRGEGVDDDGEEGGGGWGDLGIGKGEEEILRAVGGDGGGEWGMGLLVNRAVFTGVFLEMLFWGWVYSTLREESREVAVEVARRERQRREEEEEDEL